MAPTLTQPKIRFPRKAALLVAKELVRAIEPYCERLIVAGSLRRRKAVVGDIEIVYIPRFEQSLTVKQGDLLAAPDKTFVNVADEQLEHILGAMIIEKRTNSLDSEIWGPKNKLARHVASGIPVDFFSTTDKAWWSYLVCRTGGTPSRASGRFSSS